MENKIDAEILALENIVALDEACKLVSDKIDVKIRKDLDEYIQQKIETYRGYDVVSNFHEKYEDDSIWFAPENWLVKDDDGAVVEDPFFFCGVRKRATANRKDHNRFYVTSLIGAGAQKMCFVVIIEPRYFPGLGIQGCRLIIQKIFQDNRLAGQGFEYDSADSGAIIIPFVVDLKSLINAYRDEDFTEAFAPVGKAIEKSMDVMKIFHNPLEHLRHDYPQPED